MSRITHLIRTQSLGLAALVLVTTGGVAYASVGKNSVDSRAIRNGEVRTVDLAGAAVKGPKLAPGAVTGAHVAADTLTGADVDERTLGSVPSADTLGGLTAGELLRTRVYKAATTRQAGTALGDGTYVLGVLCSPGDILLSGGVADVAGSSTLVESFPTPGTTNGWSGRIRPTGSDPFTIVALCVDQQA